MPIYRPRPEGRDGKEQHEEVQSRYKLSLVREDYSGMGTV